MRQKAHKKQEDVRRLRELKRTRDLKKRKATELTAEHANRERSERKRQKILQSTAEKNSRKIKQNDKSGGRPNLGLMEREENQATEAVETNECFTVQKAATATRQVPKNRLMPETQGNRRLPNPCDDYGCKHVGVLELKELSKQCLKAYVKEGGCLFQMPCYDCKKKKEKVTEVDGTVRVLDLADLLSTKNKGNVDDIARYCNYGLASHRMVGDDVWKKAFAGDLVLCIPCYKKRLGESDRGASSNKLRTRRTRK